MRHPRHPHHHDSPFGGRHWEKAWFAGPPWGGGRRARRGDVRTALISLLADNPMHGYDLIRELEQRSGGAWRPSPGSIYPTLQLLEDEGLVTSEERDGKRVYTITDAGRAELEERRERGAGSRGSSGRSARGSGSSARPGASSRPRPCRSRARVRRPSESTPPRSWRTRARGSTRCSPRTDEHGSLPLISETARSVMRAEGHPRAIVPGMETWDALRARRNVRRYEDRAIPDDDLGRILEAARRTPSSMNQQAWDFVVVTDRDRLRELARTWRYAAHVGASAATIVLVVPTSEDRDERDTLQYDIGQVTMSIMLAAADLGIGSGHASVGDQDLARSILGVPEDRECAILIALGFPAGRPLRPLNRPNRRAIEDVVHRDRW